MRVRSGNCGSPGGVVTTTTTGSDGRYSASVSGGTYCVDVYPNPPVSWDIKTQPQTVTVNAGQSVQDINFGYTEQLT